MAGIVLDDAGFQIALLSRRDRHHPWAAAQSSRLAPPWKTCEAVLSEAFHLVGLRGRPGLAALLRRGAVVSAFDFADELDRVLTLMQRYPGVPAGEEEFGHAAPGVTLADLGDAGEEAEHPGVVGQHPSAEAGDSAGPGRPEQVRQERRAEALVLPAVLDHHGHLGGRGVVGR